MKNVKNQKGITLITLSIIIIVLVILAGIGVTSGIQAVKSAQYTAFEAEMQIMQTEINQIREGNTNLESLGTEMTQEQKNIFNQPEVSNVLNTKEGNLDEIKAGFRYYTEDYLKNELEIEAATRAYYINMENRIIISEEPVEYKKTKYYMLEQMTNGLYNVQTNKTANVEFQVNYEVLESGKINLNITNITTTGYTNKWQIRYKIAENNDDNWITTQEFEGNNYTIQVEEKEKYEVQVFHKEELQSETKQINISGSYNEEKQVNSPSLGGNNGKGLIPIKWNGENWEVCSTEDKTWYNYSNQEIEVTTEDGKTETVPAMTWANAMLSDGTYKAGEVEEGQVVQENELGSMFVWIPRFAYSINEYKVKQDPVLEDGTTQNITNVEFLKGTTNEGTSGNTYQKDYDEDSIAQGDQTPMIVHPSFTFGEKELEGIWVAKFEASMEEENLNTEENNNVINKTVKILPNAESWRYIDIGNAFKTCINMNEYTNYKLSKGANTHLMKNSEWGAVSYLSASQYGKVPTKNTSGTNDSGKYHSYTGNGDYISNITQSTTGNITGIYDMNGGTWEYVAAFWDNEGDNIKTYGSEDIFPNNKLNSEYEEYFDKYEVGEQEKTQGKEIWEMKSTEGNEQLYQTASKRVELMKKIKGDAMYEAISEWSYFGRYSKPYSITNADGTTTEYGAYEYINWLKPITNEQGELINTGEETLGEYGKSLYGDDYTLIGTYILPFMLRGGYWSDSTSSGIFASDGRGGSTYNYARF